MCQAIYSITYSTALLGFKFTAHLEPVTAFVTFSDIVQGFPFALSVAACVRDAERVLK